MTGVYTIESTYHALVTHKERCALEEGMITGTAQIEEQLCKKLRKLKV